MLTDGPNAREAKAMIAEGARRAWGGKRVTDRYDEGSGARDDSPKARMARAMQRYVDEFDHVPVLVLPALVRYREPTPFEGASIYPACQNLLLAARALGYGGVLTGWHYAVEAQLKAAAGRARGGLPRRHHHHRPARRPPRTGASATDPPSLCTARRGNNHPSGRWTRPVRSTPQAGPPRPSAPRREESSMKLTRGFKGRGQATRDPRLPPGQYDTGRQWPVLTAEVTPKLETADWTFTVEGLVEQPTTWTWDEIHALPPSTYDGDIHCVTTWSKFGMTFDGVSVDTLLAAAGPLPAATHVLAFSPHRLHHQPAARRRHRRQGVGRVGGRRRSRCRASTAARPGCSCRTCTSGRARSGSPGCALLDHDEPGFWERNGYHDRGDPWLEQRYQGD